MKLNQPLIIEIKLVAALGGIEDESTGWMPLETGANLHLSEETTKKLMVVGVLT